MPIIDEFMYKPALDVRASDVSTKLARLIEDGFLKRSSLEGCVLDVGTGYGGSYQALSKYSPNVIGVEPKGSLAHELMDYGVVRKGSLIISMPYDFLVVQPDNFFDFIGVLDMFSNGKDLRIEEFHKEALRTLRKGGQILYTVDNDTLSGPKFTKRLENLARTHGGQFVKGYPIGPDNNIYVQTKN